MLIFLFEKMLCIVCWYVMWYDRVSRIYLAPVLSGATIVVEVLSNKKALHAEEKTQPTIEIYY